MIEYKTGNILNAKTEAIVNPVNCVGVMGKGLALQFKTAFPDNFRAYASACGAYRGLQIEVEAQLKLIAVIRTSARKSLPMPHLNRS